MNVIKLSAIDSTNSYLKSLIKEGMATDGLIITTDEQTSGRGQQGASWQFQIGKSLAFSLLRKFEALPIQDQFKIAMATSLGVQKALKKLEILEVKIKWPNDILSDGKKLCGILIENTVQGDAIKESIIGIGLNVNLTEFINLPNATSMKLQTKKTYDLEKIFTEVASSMFQELSDLESTPTDVLRYEYERYLFRKDEVSQFKDATGNKFFGTILGVTALGQLRIKTKEKGERHFSFKEITLIY